MEILKPTVHFNPEIKGEIFHIDGFLEDAQLKGFYLVKSVEGNQIIVLDIKKPNNEYRISAEEIQNEELIGMKLMKLVEAK
ncbi:hypothetical protein [Lysinibacillus fusiformis]|uniref:hypothetical protein n=1 Tax=Lysinibacillus fusiformis TaxID=28031 RepID=UPI00263B6B98|nr:hypothetical protein [Lysinibacillus fusiformis]MDC6268049.1 hypothetical protein [Lysinibacillus sphaericus]MDN4967461.1 hypothetical protein [Lysinibacillus fusiformis]